MGYFKTFILMFLIILLFVFIGYGIAGEIGILVCFVIAFLSNIAAYWYSDKVILTIYKAKIVSKNNYPELHRIVLELTREAKIPMPSIYMIEEDSPNAFATGRNPSNSAIAVTRGLMEILNQRELRGVLAHELAHVINRDILIATISAVFAAAISSLASFALFFGSRGSNRQLNPIFILILALVTPLAASVIQMAISRSREFEADRVGALLTKDPLSLASALAKISSISRSERFKTAEEHPETAQMMIISPLLKRGFRDLFSTHPPTVERIQKLNEMAN